MHRFVGLGQNTQFTMYRLNDISNLKSIYSIRLYEMMMQFKEKGFIKIHIEKFKERIGVENKYSTYKNLYARVIKPAVIELNTKSLFTITFTPIREGRAIKFLTFNFSERSR
jgi:plasmid replication initiation protein